MKVKRIGPFARLKLFFYKIGLHIQYSISFCCLNFFETFFQPDFFEMKLVTVSIFNFNPFTYMSRSNLQLERMHQNLLFICSVSQTFFIFFLPIINFPRYRVCKRLQDGPVAIYSFSAYVQILNPVFGFWFYRNYQPIQRRCFCHNTNYQ